MGSAPETQAPGTVRADGDAGAFATALLTFETGVRAIDDEQELFAHLCNPSRRFLHFRQAMVMRRSSRSGPLRLVAASSLAVVDRDAPFVRWIERMVANLSKDAGLDRQRIFALPAYCDPEEEETSTYPFREFLWTPLKDGDAVVGGLLAAREVPWDERASSMGERLARLYAHAWRAIRGRNRIARLTIVTRPRALIALAVVAALSLVPVPITALAPVEVAPVEPVIVAAPFDGVVREVLVEAGSTVSAGEQVVAFEDVERRNAYEIANQAEAVAQARYARASQGAIGSARDRRELAVAEAELGLAQAEKSYSRELLEKTVIATDRAGIAVFSDRRDWAGRPVAAGEAILQIADPSAVRFAIDLPVKESLVLAEGASVRIFLDSDPLAAIDAVLVETSYQARVDRRNVLSYALSAESADAEAQPPRIGVQGTALVYGDSAPLIYVVLRRPLSTLRQMTGW